MLNCAAQLALEFMPRAGGQARFPDQRSGSFRPADLARYSANFAIFMRLSELAAFRAPGRSRYSWQYSPRSLQN